MSKLVERKLFAQGATLGAALVGLGRDLHGRRVNPAPEQEVIVRGMRVEIGDVQWIAEATWLEEA